MKDAQLIKTGRITKQSYNYSTLNQAVIRDANEEASASFHSGIINFPVKDHPNIIAQNKVIKYMNGQVYHPFFTNQAFTDMSMDLIPNFEKLYESYLDLEQEPEKLLPAINFLPALRDFSLTKEDIEGLLNNAEPKHILVQNDAIKIMLIRWQPGDLSDIHGHAIGGGLIKVLHGEIEEKRFTADSEQRLLAKSTYLPDHICYIDDVMGLHSVGNNLDSPALTLHVYTPGNYQVKKYDKAN